MAGLIQQHLDASGEDHRHRDAPTALFGLSVEPDPSCPQVGHCARDVVAHQRKLVLGLGRGMNAQLRGRKGVDQPAFTCVDV